VKAAFRWLGSLLLALSIGTTISLAVLLAMLWWKGALADERVRGMLAVLQGIQAAPPAPATATIDPDAEQPSLAQIMDARLQASLDLDLRESAIDKALGDLRILETQIKAESKRLDQWKQSFDQRVAELQTAASDTSLLELQRTLEAIQPRQAKDQIMKMLSEPAAGGDAPLGDVVAIMKAMPLDKRRKILGEFKLPEEIERLADILREIRQGRPESDLLRDMRSQLQQQPAL
jgi:hypothetical protein